MLGLMPPEPLPFDRKDFFKERKHERPATSEFSSSSSLGPGAPPCRWRESSSSSSSGYYHSNGSGINLRDAPRWGHQNHDFRSRPPGHGKQGGWHMFEESAHGYSYPRSMEKMMDDDNFRVSSGRDGKHVRSIRESRGSFSQREWRGNLWETSNGSSHTLNRQNGVSKDQKPVENMATDSPRFHHDLGTKCEENGKIVTSNGLVSPNWKPMNKWSRSGSISSRGTSLSHSSSSKTLGGVDLADLKAESQQKNVGSMASPSGELLNSTISAMNPEEMARKKPRLGWGEGLAKYEKKKVPESESSKDGKVLSSGRGEMNSQSSSLAEKSPQIARLDCASPATPSSVACSSSPGAEEKMYNKTAIMECASPNILSQLCSSLQKLEDSSVAGLASSLSMEIHSLDLNSVENVLNKLVGIKNEISKKLEATEFEIDAFETELKSLKTGVSVSNVSNFLENPEENKGVESPETATSGFNSSTNEIMEDSRSAEQGFLEPNSDGGEKGKFDDFCGVILSSNKESACRAAEAFDKLMNKEISGVDVSKLLRIPPSQPNSVMKDYFVAKKKRLYIQERATVVKYRAIQQQEGKEEKHVPSRKVRAKSQKKLELGLKTHVVHQKHRSLRPRPASKGISSTRLRKLMLEPMMKPFRSNLRMPSLILDEKEKEKSRFISSNGLVEDPCAVEKERSMINPWSGEERKLFIEKLSQFGKDFHKIATFLDHKTTADCVEFYYKNHTSEDFGRIKKKKPLKTNADYLVGSGKRWNGSLDVLGAASVIASSAENASRNRQSLTGRIFLRGCTVSKKSRGEDDKKNNEFGSDREAAAADVLAGICGSLNCEAVSSCVTMSVEDSWENKSQNFDEETCSDDSCEEEHDSTDWNDEEKSKFIEALSAYGKDFVMISRFVGTKSRDKCKVFFSKAKKRLGLDRIEPICAGKPETDEDPPQLNGIQKTESSRIHVC